MLRVFVYILLLCAAYSECKGKNITYPNNLILFSAKPSLNLTNYDFGVYYTPGIKHHASHDPCSELGGFVAWNFPVADIDHPGFFAYKSKEGIEKMKLVSGYSLFFNDSRDVFFCQIPQHNYTLIDPKVALSTAVTKFCNFLQLTELNAVDMIVEADTDLKYPFSADKLDQFQEVLAEETQACATQVRWFVRNTTMPEDALRYFTALPASESLVSSYKEMQRYLKGVPEHASHAGAKALMASLMKRAPQTRKLEIALKIFQERKRRNELKKTHHICRKKIKSQETLEN